MRNPPVGDLELEVLRYVSERAPISVREVAEQFGEPRGLARTTILTVMERLRKKSYLTRTHQAGVFVYAPGVAQDDVLRGLVSEFVKKTLAGSVSPFVTYLAETKDISNAELDKLRQFVEELQTERKEDRNA